MTAMRHSSPATTSINMILPVAAWSSLPATRTAGSALVGNVDGSSWSAALGAVAGLRLAVLPPATVAALVERLAFFFARLEGSSIRPDAACASFLADRASERPSAVAFLFLVLRRVEGAEEEQAFKDKLKRFAEQLASSGDWEAEGFSWDEEFEAWVMLFGAEDVSKLDAP